MAEEYKDQAVSVQEEGAVEVKDRGLFDYFKGKKEEAPEEKPHHEEDQQESLVAGVEKIHIEEGHKEEVKKEKEEEEKHGISDKLHRSHSSSSSSSSDEEVEVEGEGGVKEKIKKKKGLKEKIDEKFHGGEKKDEKPANVPLAAEDTSVVVEKVDVHETPEASEEEKKEGFLQKIKEKFPGHGKKPSEESGFVPPAVYPTVPAAIDGGALEHGKEQEVEGLEGKEKKGFLGKIMEKLPGYHKHTGEEGDKSPASH